MDGGDADLMVVEKFTQVVNFSEDAVRIPLEKRRFGRRRGARAGVRMDGADDEEDGDEKRRKHR